MKKILILFVSFVITIPIFGGGYGINIQGQKQVGMGHIGTGLFFGDGTGVFFNPGMISRNETKFNLNFGVSPIFGENRYQNPTTFASQDTDNPVGTPFSLYGTYKFNDKFSGGLGIYTPFGNSISWEEGWEGRALITDIQLMTIFFQPTLAYNINDWISIGAGVVFAYGAVDLDRDIPNVNGALNLKGTTTGWGFNTGVFIKINENLSFGLSYRSKIDMVMEDGDAKFDVPVSLQSRIIPDDKFDSEIPAIAAWNFGLGLKFNERLTVGVDINLYQWSDYENLIFTFKKNAELSDTQIKDWDNTVVFRIGFEYDLNEKIDLRFGYYFDPSPVPENYFSPETPSLDNHGFTAGASYQINEKLGLDLSLLLLNGEERNAGYDASNFRGNFKSFAFIPGFGLTYKF